MRLLRSITRRGFNVSTAGWFSVLKPNTWFPASRLPGPFRYRDGQRSPAGQAVTVAPNIITLAGEQRGLLRPALTVLGAIGITLASLWWIMHP